MDTQLGFELASIFLAARRVMSENRLAYNALDSLNGDHGDHMLQIFDVAVRAAQDKQADGMAAAMEYAGELLLGLPSNGSAQVYARGLSALGAQFAKYQLDLPDLLPYMRKVLQDGKDSTPAEPVPRSNEILKALVTALAAWQQGESGKEVNPLDLGYMFDLGIAYMLAKGRNPTRSEVIADAAASVSPLKKTPHRYESGKAAILALLRAMGGKAGQGE
jgi:hypothetical protein